MAHRVMAPASSTQRGLSEAPRAPRRPSGAAALRRLRARLGADSRVWTWSAPLLAVALFVGPQLMTYPVMDGWSAFPLGSADYLPYRDYFYPVTPLTFAEARFFGLFPLPLLASRLVLLVLPALLAWSVTSLTRSFVSRRIGFVLATFVAASLALLRLEPLAGWNTQFFVYTSVGVALLERSLSHDGSDRVGERPSRGALAFGALAGLAFTFAMMAKQTTLITVVVILVGLFLWLGIRFGAAARRRSLAILGTVLVAPTVAVATLAVYLFSRHAFGAFVSNMLSGGGKNPQLTKGLAAVWNEIYAYVANPRSMATVLALVIILLVARRDLRRDPTGLAPTTLFVATAFLAYLALDVTLSHHGLRPDYVVLAAAGCALTVVLPGRRRAVIPFTRRALSTRLVLAVVGLPLVAGALSMLGDLPGYLASLASVQYGWVSFAVLSSILLGYLMLSDRARPAPASPHAQRAQRFPEGRAIAVALAVLAALGSLVNVLSSGGTLYLQFFIPSLAVYLAVLAQWISRGLGRRPFLPPLVAAVCVSTLAFVGAVVATPYSWFGWQEQSLLSGPRTWASSGYLRGIALSPGSAAVYQQLADAERDAAELSGAGDPRVFTFPNVPAAASLTDLRPYGGLPCVVLWFDVCPNAMAEDSLEQFTRDPAEVIVWTDPPEDITRSHETNFIRGRSALRDWIGYRNAEVLARRWVVVDTVPVTESSPNRWPITVYARVTDAPPGLDATLGSVSISQTGADVDPANQGRELTDGWYWTGERRLRFTIRSIAMSPAAGVLRFDLDAAPCLSSVDVVVGSADSTRRVTLSDEDGRSRSFEIPYEVDGGGSTAISIVPQQAGCQVGRDQRWLAVKVSHLALGPR